MANQAFKEDSPEEQGFSLEESVRKLRPHLKKLWDARRKLLYINGAVVAITVLYLLFLVKPYYESSVTILPDYGSKETSLSQLGGLASLAGVSVGQGSPTEVYQNLLTSEAVLTPVIYAEYKTEKYPDSVDLIQYFKIDASEDDPNTAKREAFLKTFELLAKSGLTTDLGRMIKILTVKATMPEAQLSADVVNNAVESLDRYVRTKRRSYATEQRLYIAKRLGQLKDSLTFAENALKDFRERNRMVVQSPELTLKQARLSRNVEILNAVFLELSKQLELAKIDEVKDTPIINIREFAKDPVIKAGPKRLNTLIINAFLSAMISISWFLLNDKLHLIVRQLKGRTGPN